MPVKHLPTPAGYSTFGPDSVPAGFDCSPLTAPALEQGDYDGGMAGFSLGLGMHALVRVFGPGLR